MIFRNAMKKNGIENLFMAQKVLDALDFRWKKIENQPLEPTFLSKIFKMHKKLF